MKSDRKGGGESIKPYAESFYKSTAWREARESYLISQNYICEQCGEVANTVHHKQYITPQNIDDQEITLSHKNFMAVCESCHNKIHKTTSDKPKLPRRYKVNELGEVLW